MPEQERCSDRAGERNEVQDDVIDRCDEWSVDHVRDRDHKAAREGHGQEEAHHTSQYRRRVPWRLSAVLARVGQPAQSAAIALRRTRG